MGYLPTREGALLGWSSNFSMLINDDATRYGLTIEQAADYATLHDTYRTAFITATHPPTRTPPAIQAKNDAKHALLEAARELVKIIQAYPGTTNEMRRSLDITVPDDEPTPIPPPGTAPNLSIMSTIGRVVKIRLRDAENSDNRGKPSGVTGAAVFSYVGETPPSDPMTWSFLFNTSRTIVDVEFPSTVPGNSKVWITAFWFNAKKQSSPAAASVTTTISDGMSQAA